MDATRDLSPSGTKVWGRLPAISELQSQVSSDWSDYWEKPMVFGWFWLMSDGIPHFFWTWDRRYGDINMVALQEWKAGEGRSHRRRGRSLEYPVYHHCTKNIQKRHHIPWNVSPPLHYFICLHHFISNIIHHCITIMSIMSGVHHRSHHYITMWADQQWYSGWNMMTMIYWMKYQQLYTGCFVDCWFKQESTKHTMIREGNHHFLHFFTAIPGWTCPLHRGSISAVRLLLEELPNLGSLTTKLTKHAENVGEMLQKVLQDVLSGKWWKNVQDLICERCGKTHEAHEEWEDHWRYKHKMQNTTIDNRPRM